ncbi:flagellar basal body-associated protein FliL [Thiobacter aerophilum]|uniref:Flagellar protein FliL n=1 Tax=Thiobacter aerophilum TaxID=3121275 RepID=A0ABV0EBC3_9BURK
MAQAKNAPPPADGGDAAPKKKSKFLIITIVAVLLAGGGGGAAWWFLAGSKGGGSHETAHKEETEKPPVFTRLDQFTVNLQRGADGEDHYLQVEVDLQVANEKVIEQIKLRMPQIRNATLLLMSSKTAEELAPVEGKQKLANDIVTQVNQILGVKDPKQGVLAVYFSAFVIQ